MNLDKYDCLIDPTYTSFSFESSGPNGSIRKVANYQPTGEFLTDGREVINLSFGDWDQVYQKIDDSTTSNNHDRDKVLSTVASTILSYCEKHGNVPVFAKGSSPARTRLYQMSINSNLAEIEKHFHVLGLYKENWRKFQRGVNYDAFLVIKK